MRYAIAAVLIAMTGLAQAEQIVGSWIYKTKGNPADFFSLRLLRQGNYVCGQLSSTSAGTNRVDASWVIGKIDGNVATVEFESGFNEQGKRGLALVTLGRDYVRWHVTRELTPSYIWDDAKLKPEAWEKRHKLAVSSWCNRHWKEIEEETSGHLDLRP